MNKAGVLIFEKRREMVIQIPSEIKIFILTEY